MPKEGEDEQNKNNKYEWLDRNICVVERGDTKLAYCTVIIVSILAILVLVKK